LGFGFRYRMSMSSEVEKRPAILASVSPLDTWERFGVGGLGFGVGFRFGVGIWGLGFRVNVFGSRS
jgi:hypothetical protein